MIEGEKGLTVDEGYAEEEEFEREGEKLREGIGERTTEKMKEWTSVTRK